MITRRICLGIALLLAAFGGGATVYALYPNMTVCYATDGQAVETTYLDGDGAFYPIETEARIEQGTNGFTVTHQVHFIPIGSRVYLPVIRSEP